MTLYAYLRRPMFPEDEGNYSLTCIGADEEGVDSFIEHLIEVGYDKEDFIKMESVK